MAVVEQDKFEERRQKIMKNVFSDIEEYYGDPDEWGEVSTDLVKFGIFYSETCEHWLNSIFLYRYDVVPFAERFLMPSTNAKVDERRLQKHHYNLLSQYAIDRATVELILTGIAGQDSLKSASDYHNDYLKVNHYASDSDVVNELDTESMLSIVVPKMIVNKLLCFDDSDLIEHIHPALKSREKIWMYAWRMINCLHYSDNSGLESCWQDLVNEWKNCFIQADFHAFNSSYIVLLHYLYCKALGRTFDIENISKDILKA